MFFHKSAQRRCPGDPHRSEDRHRGSFRSLSDQHRVGRNYPNLGRDHTSLSMAQMTVSPATAPRRTRMAPGAATLLQRISAWPRDGRRILRPLLCPARSPGLFLGGHSRRVIVSSRTQLRPAVGGHPAQSSTDAVVCCAWGGGLVL